MALALITNKIKEITTCSICQNLMMSPVSINCGHSFCQMCLQQYLYRVQPSQGEKMFPCPQCHAPFNKDSFRANRHLESITEVFEEMDHNLVCEAHGEQLQLFCEDDEQLICWRCERALQHQGHTTALVEDVCQGYKEKLQKAVAKLSELHRMYESESIPDITDKGVAVIVTLDPDTAHPALILSQDQRQVSRGCSQQNLELSSRRFTTFPCVLGYEGFTSGKHYFEVDVGEGSVWDVGVCMENVQRGLGMKKTPEFGFWAIQLCTENGYVALTSPRTALELRERPLLVGVVLDYEAGAVSFYNMTAGSHIFTFPKASFSATLRPFFQVYQHSPLFLSP